MEQPYLQQASVQDVSDFLSQHNNKLFSFVSELMDIMFTGEDQSQTDQPNSLAEGPPILLLTVFASVCWKVPAPGLSAQQCGC
eukprot:632672-Pelagomonas_calceolata.AAC.1